MCIYIWSFTFKILGQALYLDSMSASLLRNIVIYYYLYSLNNIIFTIISNITVSIIKYIVITFQLLL